MDEKPQFLSNFGGARKRDLTQQTMQRTQQLFSCCFSSLMPTRKIGGRFDENSGRFNASCYRCRNLTQPKLCGR